MKRIKLDGTLKSDLNWSIEPSDDLVLWELDLGLFDRLIHPISNEMQLRSLGLSIEHFVNFYPEDSLGVCLYSGDLDFSLTYPWDVDQEANFHHWCDENRCGPNDPFMKKLYCRDAATEYLNLLANFLPDSITPYLLLDASSIQDPYDCARLIDPERTERFQRAIKGANVMTRDLKWGDELTEPNKVNTGLFLPQSVTYQECSANHFRETLQALYEKRTPYRVIAEDHLIRDWDGLDFLIIDPKSVSKFGMRKIMGFQAAGGNVIEMETYLAN